MPLEGTYEPSAWDTVAEHVDRYERTGGREGAEMQGAPCIILWTRGRQTGSVRKAPLIRVTDGENYVVVASMGGAPQHPAWYLNLSADPHVTLQDKAQVNDYVARTANPDEKALWWPLAVASWPDYDAYQAASSRDIPVVLLDPR
jgi:deazaflavin-dependent oxidoreductase (nitroreductase family)